MGKREKGKREPEDGEIGRWEGSKNFLGWDSVPTPGAHRAHLLLVFDRLHERELDRAISVFAKELIKTPPQQAGSNVVPWPKTQNRPRSVYQDHGRCNALAVALVSLRQFANEGE